MLKSRPEEMVLREMLLSFYKITFEDKNVSQVAPDTDFISTVGRRTCFEVNHLNDKKFCHKDNQNLGHR